MRRVGWPPFLAPLVALALMPGAATAKAPQTSLPDVEDEVMCTICGTLLELSESPQAQRERVFVKRLIAAGKTKAEIKDALVAQYGRNVLALPARSGFSLSAYLVPIFAFLAVAAALAAGVWRWRRSGDGRDPRSSSAFTSQPDPEDAERLEADLARYDL